MADISIVKTPNNVIYNIKDSTARTDITNLTSRVAYLESTTPTMVVEDTYNRVYTDANSDGNVVITTTGTAPDVDSTAY